MCHAAVSSVHIPLACRVSNRTNCSMNRFFSRGEGLVFVSAMPLRNTDAKRPGMHSNAKRWNEEVMRGRNKSQAPWRQADGPMQKAQKVAYPGSARLFPLKGGRHPHRSKNFGLYTFSASRVKKNFGSSRICGKRRVDGNQTILVWRTLASKRHHTRDIGPELEALVTFTAPHNSGMNQTFQAG